MRTRLRKLLHELLQKDDISLESGIVNDFIYRMAQIEIPGREDEKHTFPGFQLDSWSKSEALEFSLPVLSMDQLEQLLAFFKVPKSKYNTNSPITLDENFVFNELMPAFNSYYQKLKEENSPLITKYRVKSKPILESSAISTLEEYIQKALKTHLTDDASEASQNSSRITDVLLLLKSKVENLRQFPVLYRSIIDTAPQISRLHQLNGDEKLENYLSLISQGIALFTRYNRYESVLAIKAFMKEMETFLNEGFDISSERCDVIEESLLSVIGATLGKKGECKLDSGSDESRMVFRFTDMDKENAKKVVHYFQSLGDETATEGYGYSEHGSPIPESALRYESVSSSDYTSTKPKDTLEYHSIEVDGKFFYDKVFSKLKKQIESMPSVDLDKYREASKEFLKEKAAKQAKVVKPNKHALFQPAEEIDVELGLVAFEAKY